MVGPTVEYESAKGMAMDPDPGARCALAADPDSPPEILYFLAKDPSVEVRRAVASNPSTPHKAGTYLAKDEDYGVRCELGRKIVGEGLGDDERTDLWRMGFTIIETLATDHVVRVRQALAEAIKGLVSAPRPIVIDLARDPEAEVATPILRHSPVLTDDDLIEIVGGDAPEWARTAIASRDGIGARVAESIAAADSVPAVTEMLRNHRAAIPDATIEKLAARAEEVEPWRAPLVRRPSLPARAVLKLARFVSGSLLAVLQGRDDFEPETKRQLTEIAETRGHDEPVRARQGETKGEVETAPSKRKRKRSGAGGGPKNSHRAGGNWESSEDRAWRLFEAGRLNDNIVELAIDAREFDFVAAAIALRSHLPLPLVQNILSSQSAKTVTALCWKAQFKMRFALDVQKRVARIPPGKLLYARDGYDYPLSPEEMDRKISILID